MSRDRPKSDVRSERATAEGRSMAKVSNLLLYTKNMWYENVKAKPSVVPGSPRYAYEKEIQLVKQ